jgi:hypothetical protein
MEDEDNQKNAALQSQLKSKSISTSQSQSNSKSQSKSQTKSKSKSTPIGLALMEKIETAETIQDLELLRDKVHHSGDYPNAETVRSYFDHQVQQELQRRPETESHHPVSMSISHEVSD